MPKPRKISADFIGVVAWLTYVGFYVVSWAGLVGNYDQNTPALFAITFLLNWLTFLWLLEAQRQLLILKPRLEVKHSWSLVAYTALTPGILIGGLLFGAIDSGVGAMIIFVAWLGAILAWSIVAIFILIHLFNHCQAIARLKDCRWNEWLLLTVAVFMPPLYIHLGTKFINQAIDQKG